MTKNLSIALCSDDLTGVATCSIAINGDIPGWIHLMPLGEIKANDGRRWVNSDPQSVIDASMASIDLVIDYEHQTDYSQKNGVKAPAAGWITAMELRSDGIWGRVEWTEAAAHHLRTKEYRFISPTFFCDKESGKVSRILRAALVNNPAIHELTALAKIQIKELYLMAELLKTLTKALGLPEGASEDDVLTKIEEMALAHQSDADMVSAMCKALKVEGEPTVEILETALASRLESASGNARQDPDPGQYVTMASYQELATQLNSLQESLVESKATAAVDAAIEAGKVTPGQREWAMSYASKSPEDFAAFVEKQPRIVSSGGDIIGLPDDSGSGLTAEQVAICKNLGITENEFIAARDGKEKE